MEKKNCLLGCLDTKAFTLIELLVVVLIIGILAAVALPQYQKAVEKSRATQALVLLRAAYDAATTYYLANGAWPSKFDELDIQMPKWTGNTQWYTYGSARDTISNDDWSLQLGNYSGDEYIMIGRISGPYAGGGFGIFNKCNTSRTPRNVILCGERVSAGITFTKDSASYCKGIFKATYTPDASSTRWYRLP